MLQMNLFVSFSEKPKNFVHNLLKLRRFTADDEVHFECAQVCHICQQIIVNDSDRVRDHCHLTGVYCGVAHNACNLNYRLNPKGWKLPVIMHNLKGYDGHLIVKSLKSEFGKVRIIPQNMLEG